MPKQKTTEEFIEEANGVHNKFYCYKKSIYVGSKNSICIICPEHGEFWQTPSKHLQGRGCPQCNGGIRLTTGQFIEKAKKVHDNKYDYSKVNYQNSKTKICIICPEHGEFWQTPHLHLSGYGCSYCGGSKHNTLDEFINKAREVHNNKYDYSKVEYKNNKTKVCIICPIHGEFWQTPSKHINEQNGCPHCKESSLESEITQLLIQNKLNFIPQYRPQFLKTKSNGQQSLDFYLPDYNVAIECQGEQHFVDVEFFKNQFNKQYKYDLVKFNKCNQENISILYYTKYRVDNNWLNNREIYKQNLFFDKEKLLQTIYNKKIRTYNN